jgi:hypothetical protein
VAVTVTTAQAPDSTPDPFNFVDQTNVALNTLVETAAVTVSGINMPADISVTGGEYSINNGAYTAVAGTVTNGQTVKVRHTSSESNSTTTNTVLTIGGISGTFTSTTVAPAEVPPVMGNVPDQTYTSGSAITNLNISNYVTLTNGDVITAYTLTGALPTGLSFNSTTGVLSGTPTQAGTFPMSVTATDNDGASNSDSFTITVNAPDTTPDAFDITDMTGQALSTAVTTNAVTIA